jgi:Ribbon-helix-helix protein, copG family
VVRAGQELELLFGPPIMINKIMGKSILLNKTKRRPGRPPQGPFVGARLPQDLIDRIDAWAARECDNSRSEAIRRLLELGLAASPPATAKRTRKPKADRGEAE